MRRIARVSMLVAVGGCAVCDVVRLFQTKPCAYDAYDNRISACCLVSQVFERVEMEEMFGSLVTVIAGGSFCVKEEIEHLFSTPVFDYQQKLWFVKPEEFTDAALEVLTGTGASVTVVAPDEEV